MFRSQSKRVLIKKQDELIKQLQKDQKAITTGLEDIAIMNALPAALPAPTETTKLPTDYMPKMIYNIDDESKKKSLLKSNIDKGFTPNEMQKLIDYNLSPPSQILKSHLDGSIDIDSYDEKIGKQLQYLGRKKGQMSKTRKMKEKNKEQIDEFTKDIKLIQNYRQRLKLIPEGTKTLGEGIYTQKKRNAYKISQNGQYGGLVIDLPKLHGHLKVVANKMARKYMINKLTLTHLIFSQKDSTAKRNTLNWQEQYSMTLTD